MADSEDYQSDEELEAHYGTRGPVAAANTWLSDAYAGDVRAVWHRTDSALRLVLVQAWLWANRSAPDIAPLDLDEAAKSLSGRSFGHPLWEDFATTWASEVQSDWPDFDHSTWGASSRPRPVAIDHEVVVYVETGGQVMSVTAPTLVDNAIVLLMHRTDEGWLVAGIGDKLPTPGWPPTAG